jgi:predicted permease
MRLLRLLDDLFRDLRYGFRVLTRSPLFSLVAIGSLAIGIGGAASVFTVMNAVLLRNLPVPNPQQLVSAEKVGTQQRSPRFSWLQFDDARRELQGRAELAAFIYPTAMNVRIGSGSTSAPSERGVVQLVSGEFFSVLRQQPQAGRLLAPSDNEKLGSHPVAVISDGYWERQFRRAPDAVGKTMVINGTVFTVVGVASPEFYGAIVAPRGPEIWLPLMMQSSVRYASNASNSGNSDPRKPWPPQREIEWLNVIARVADGGEIPRSAAAMTVLFQRDSRNSSDSPDADALRRIEGQRVVLEPAARGVSGFRNDLTTPLRVLLAMVGVLLAIACGNVASLLISRANARDREIAIRLSIGAGRGRVIRQLLAETMLMATVGGGLGLLAATWGRDLLLSMFTRGSAVVDMDTSFDWRVLAFAVGVTALTGLLAGAGPALRGTRVALAESLKSQGRSDVADGSRRGVLIGKTLVTAQIAFCLLLLVLAALFTRSLQSLLRIDVGYDREQVLVARMDVRSVGFAPEERQALYSRILESLSALPGVTSASISMNGPLGTSQRTSSLSVEGYTPGPDERMLTNEEVVTDKYFETVGLRIIEGRGFQPEDRAPGSRASIINQSMAKRFFPNGGALGKRWNYGGDLGPDASLVVGIVEDAKYVSVRSASPSMVYRLSPSTPDEVLSNIEVRASVPPSQLVGSIRRILAESEPGLPVYDIVPLEERLERGLANDRMVARLTSVFGGVALLLACLGLYGTISYGVTRRVTELGVRMALGAARRDVLWLVMREASVLVLAGAAVGVPLAYAAGRGVGSLLYGARPVDVAAYLVAAGLLMLVGGIAAFLPAHRASRIDPMVALRKQ